MKKNLKISAVLLILYFCLEIFTYYCLSYLPYYYAANHGIEFNPSDLYPLLKRYLPFLSLILSAILIDRVSIFRNLRIYFIPILIGILLCMFGTYVPLVIGISLFILSKSFIQINIYLKLYTTLKKGTFFNDRVFLVLYLALNLFGFLAPTLSGSLRMVMDTEIAYTLPSLIIWIIFGVFFLWRYSEDEYISDAEDNNKLLRNPILIIVAVSFLGFLVYDHFDNKFFQIQGDYREQQDYNLQLELIPLIVLYVVGLGFLLLPMVKHTGKIIFSLILTVVIGGLILFAPFSIESIDNYTLIIKSLINAVEILIYPAIITLILTSCQTKHKGTILAAFFILLYLIDYINLGLLKADSKILLGIFELVLFGLLYLIIRYKKNEMAAHTR
jgi:hypothetical protein